MPLFAAIVSYSIFKLGTFNVKSLLTEFLVSTLWILMFSMLLFSSMTYARPIILVTLIAFAFLGIQVVRSVRREVEQREQLETLTQDLEKANVRLKELDKAKSEFVSIASHQLRSPLTSIRGYASMLLEGSFGDFPEKAKEALGRIDSSAKNMVLAVEDYLNVSRIESGNMNYDLVDFNFKNEVEHVADDVRSAAMKNGLVLLFRSNLNGSGIVHADKGKTIQIAHNLINNAIKYTKKGTITIFVHDEGASKKIHMDIIDTGVGMSEKTLGSIFGKFTRAEDASRTNAHGTGLGLFVALKMAEDMGGTITAHSEGEGKGSRFTLELPLA